MKLIVFEDQKYEQLYPVSLTRPVFELKCGVNSLIDKIKIKFPTKQINYFVRDYIAPIMKENYPADSVNDLKQINSNEDIVMVNGRCLFIDKTPNLPNEECWVEKDSDFVYAKIKKDTLKNFNGDTLEKLIDYAKAKVKQVNLDCIMINYPWDLVNHNPKAIIDYFKSLNKAGVIEGTMANQSVIYGPQEQVYIAKKAEIHPFVCIDTKGGPVIIDEGAIVHPFSRIEGPSYIGKGTMIVGANVREGCSIGPICRVGGEVEESIFHSYSNKFHDGFIGHSYVGEWINLGALTTNSDLKNDYTGVKVTIKGQPVDTGSIKVGSFIGDHTKTSIGTYLNTGSNVGALCILVGSGGVLPKYIPSGSWFLNNSVTKGFGFKKLLQTAEIAMGRRKVQITENYKKMLEKVYEIAKADRDVLIAKTKFGE